MLISRVTSNNLATVIAEVEMAVGKVLAVYFAYRELQNLGNATSIAYRCPLGGFTVESDEEIEFLNLQKESVTHLDKIQNNIKK